MVEKDLHALVQKIQQFLSARNISLLLTCSEASLRHPLLNFLTPGQRATCYGAPLPVERQGETLLALCDIAQQRSQIWQVAASKSSPPLVLLPLETAVGILGVLVFSTQHRRFLSQTEQQTLAQYLPTIAQHIESVLANVYLRSPIIQDTHRAHEVISIMSHELRIPLTAIKGYASLLQTYGTQADPRPGIPGTTMSPGRQKHYLDALLEQTRHLEVLVNDLSDLARLDNGCLTLRRTQCNLVQICENAVRFAQDRAFQHTKTGYHLRCQPEAALPTVWADPDRIQQILNNLVENAMKYSPQGGEICLKIGITELKKETESLTVIVEDHGIGITQSEQTHLFQPFVRLHHPLTNHIQGSGLGLYIARKLVEAHDGEIQLQSKPGQGTSVRFTLPVVSSSIAMSHSGSKK